MRSFVKYNSPAFAWAVFILWMCLMPGSDLPRIKIPHLDKIVHFTFYFVFASLIFFGWKKQNYFSALHQNIFAKILFVAVSYGIAIEIAQQLFTVDRHFELADIFANTAGALAGSVISNYFSRKIVV